MKTFKRLFGYTWRNKYMLIAANFALIISAGCTVMLPLLCGRMVDSIRAKDSLTVGAIQFSILTIVMAVFSSIRGYTFNQLG
jgi:ABC-type multidrug transport system fused ATPase/permease subunit